jgi:CRISPR-associated exonuclease Cas4
MKWMWNLSAKFYERVDRLGLHGLHFQHVDLCERRAWMYLHRINFAQWYDRVELGMVRQETSYARDHSVRGLFGLAPDRIDWERRIVYENKGTGGAVEAADNQTAFYAVMLSIATGVRWLAVTHVLSTRRPREVELDEGRLGKLWEASERLERLAAMENVPKVPRIPLCSVCSVARFCGYE